ncbi:hypothetical protein [Paractinoplanes rishiriensis]|uniref:DUF4386 family protein n=1 Tax=Paractinoplanes rishiriensis TaxID=1050105 RepID=A0A919MRV6_9ACTN|nr:hypothetical protein [Actinoplanes rishiriensis]GIE97611.1 hypothetical protein Ari01nite_50760 [Actinoplanes rishiriensis]
MSTGIAATPSTTVTPAGPGTARATLIATLLSLASLAVAVVVLWQPWGERDALGYADIAPHRDAAWLGTLVDGLAFAVVGVTLGLAVCILAPKRGSTPAAIGAVATGLGGIAFGTGMFSFGALAWFATDTSTLPAAAGTALMSRVEGAPGHLMAVQMTGFLLFTVGSLILMAALWRARSVPRWLPVAFLVLTVALFALSGVALNVVEAAQFLLLPVIGFYLVRAGGRTAT